MDDATYKPVLELSDISKSYGQKIKTTVLHSVNLAIHQGSFNAIIGQSGSGKSTLLNIIGTLLTPDTGIIRINNRIVNGLRAGELSKLRSAEIGFVFQNHLLLPEFTALENVLIPHQLLKGGISKEAKIRAESLLELVGLTKVKNNQALDMSGGQQQRVAIARALMNQPSLILADEPTGNLDTNTTDKIYQLLREINAQTNTTFIIVTHDRKVAELTDRIISISDGRIESDINNAYRKPKI